MGERERPREGETQGVRGRHLGRERERPREGEGETGRRRERRE